jgi:ribonuclease HI
MDGSRTVKGKGVGVYGQPVDRRLSISLGKRATVFQAEVYAILACAHETETQDRPEKYVSVCSDSQTTLKELQAAKTSSSLVRQCQKVLKVIYIRHTVGLYWVPGHAGSPGNEIADKLARDSSVQKFVGPQPFLGVSRQNIRKIKRWMDNQHLIMWKGSCSI